MNNWYQTLEKPALTPPGWIFGPVWSVLYLMIFVSIGIFIKRNRLKKPWIYGLVVFHLITNFIWTPLFFGMQNPGVALIDIALLDISLILMIIFFWKVDKLSSILLWPYLAWVLFATYLNCGFYILNR